MKSTTEAVAIPTVFLTVALFGGMRIADRIALVPPPLFTLVLALLLLGLLVRSGALAPDRLVHPGRTALANANGLVVVLTVFAASAQAFNLATPDAGLPRLICEVFMLVLLLNTMAASPDRVRTLRSLAVVFGSAFLLKFIVLASLSERPDGVVTRVVLAVVEGVTLGTLRQAPLHPATGYIAFFTLVLFMVGVALLPSRQPDSTALAHRLRD